MPGMRRRPASLTMRTLRLPLAQRACAMAIVAAATVSMLGACTITPWQSSTQSADDALVPDSAAASPSATPIETPIETSAPTVVAEVPPSSAAGGFYRVKAGDTLNRIAVAHKQRAADIAAWNKLPAQGMVKVGQLLRVGPPASEAATHSAQTPAPSPAPTAAPSHTAPAPATSSPSTLPRSALPAPVAAARINARLAWPVSGSVVTPFAPGKSRSIVIACAPGAPVRAAAAGRVMYAGSGMKGYGKLVIVKHDAHLITAYGRNGRLLVKQGETVKLGQPIATSGADAAGVGALLFEVRENGKPVDPVAQLPRKQP